MNEITDNKEFLQQENYFKDKFEKINEKYNELLLIKEKEKEL